MLKNFGTFSGLVGEYIRKSLSLIARTSMFQDPQRSELNKDDISPHQASSSPSSCL